MGMVNQLSNFSKEIAACAGPLRPLLKAKTVFVWLPEHTEAFLAVKKALLSPLVLAPFDKDLPIIQMTDASKKNGLGFALMQEKTNKSMSLVMCGSRFITETERRYAMVELELLAAAWAMEKSHMYLAGIDCFRLVTDHRPLIPILNAKMLSEMENPRILRLRRLVKGTSRRSPRRQLQAPT
jgi:hypothetical protein